ncbi:MAG: hypothetical protein ACF8NJ_02910 [Phycisphaerales bacterium JB038]
MTIDPRLYEKYSGRKGDPRTRLGQALAKDAKVKAGRDAMPKGVTGGLRVTRLPGSYAQVWLWLKNLLRPKG